MRVEIIMDDLDSYGARIMVDGEQVEMAQSIMLNVWPGFLNMSVNMMDFREPETPDVGLTRQINISSMMPRDQRRIALAEMVEIGRSSRRATIPVRDMGNPLLRDDGEIMGPPSVLREVFFG